MANLSPTQYFSPNPTQQRVALELYEQVAGMPLVCPHGHVDPGLFADPNYQFGSPVDLLLPRLTTFRRPFLPVSRYADWHLDAR